MKVAIFSDVYYPITSGVVIYTIITANKLVELDHKVYLFIPKPDKKIDKKILNKKIKVYYFKGLKVFLYKKFKFINILSIKDIKLLKKINPDIIYFQTPFMMGLKAIALAKILKKPLIGIFHTHISTHEFFSILGKSFRKINPKKIGWAYLRYFYNKCDIIISPSQYIKKDMEHNKINRKIIIVNNFVNKKTIDNKESNLLIHKNSFVYLGRISEEKNLYCLIKAFRMTLMKRKCYLYMIGEGSMLEKIKNYINKYHLKNNVLITGNIKNEIILKTDLMTKFLAFTTMSNTEVQPMSILESMFKGLPILGPRSLGITEMIKDNGILVKKNSSTEMSKAMLKILNNPKLRKRMSKASIRMSKNYESNIKIRELEKIFLNAISSNKIKRKK